MIVQELEFQEALELNSSSSSRLAPKGDTTPRIHLKPVIVD